MFVSASRARPFGRAPFRPGVVAFGTTLTSLGQMSRWEVLVRGRAKVVHDQLAREIPPPLTHVDRSSTTVLGIGLEQLTGWHYCSPSPAPKSAAGP